MQESQSKKRIVWISSWPEDAVSISQRRMRHRYLADSNVRRIASHTSPPEARFAMTEKKDDQYRAEERAGGAKPIHQVAHFKLEFSMDLSTRFLSFATTDGYEFTFSLSEQMHMELKKANAELSDIQARLLA